MEHYFEVDIAMLQYFQGKLQIAQGDIGSVEGHNVFYQIGTAKGSSRSPTSRFGLQCVGNAQRGKSRFDCR